MGRERDGQGEGWAGRGMGRRRDGQVEGWSGCLDIEETDVRTPGGRRCIYV
jgi:hypothetical protein